MLHLLVACVLAELVPQEVVHLVRYTQTGATVAVLGGLTSNPNWLLVLLLLFLPAYQFLDYGVLHLGLLELLVNQLGGEPHLLSVCRAEYVRLMAV